MECDKNFGLLNSRADAEIPSDWWNELSSARTKPNPITVIECNQSMFLAVKGYLDKIGCYKNTCPFQTRPIREIVISQAENTQLVKFRSTWNGPWVTSVILQRGKNPQSRVGQFGKAYSCRIPIKAIKYENLQSLKRFCSAEAQSFYDSLPTVEKTNGNMANKRENTKQDDSSSDDMDDFVDDSDGTNSDQ